jgi:predicted ribosome quality control (RQC) complex YloA/Tae2 family protein
VEIYVKIHFAMENFSINFLVKEIKNTLKFDVFLSKIKLKKDFLEFKIGKKILCFPMRNRFAPFFIGNANFESDEVAGPDVNIFRKYLEQSRLISIEKPFLERVVFFTFSKTMIWGEKKEFSFVVDAGAVPVKWYIVDSDMNIIYSKNDGSAVAGTKYMLPVDNRKNLFEQPFIDDTCNNLKDFISTYKGFGPAFAKEFLMSDDKKIFLSKLKQFENIKGYLYKKDVFPFQFLSIKEEPVLFDTMSEALCYKLFKTVEHERFTFLKGRLMKKSTDSLKKKEKLLKKLKKELLECEDSKKYLLKGELLSANFHMLKRGMEEIELLDYYSNNSVKIQLDATLSPEGNIGKYYNKATKAANKKKFVKERVRELEGEIASIKDRLYLLENVTGLEELREFDDNKNTKKGKKKKKEVSGLVRYDLKDGFIVYAGKTADANHYIYTRKLTENDLWFHAKDIPGSHVVLKLTNNKQKAEDFAITIAAEIAAYYSKGQNDTFVEVQYTTKENLYSSKGKGKAFVLLRKFKTITVTPNKHNELKKCDK